MKRIIVVLIAILAAVVSSRGEDMWSVKGTWKGGEGQSVYLCSRNGRTLTKVDSCRVRKDGTFQMKGQLDTLCEMAVQAKGQNEDILICDEPVVLEVVDTSSDHSSVKFRVLGGPEQIAYDTATKVHLEWALSKISAGFLASKVKKGEMPEDSAIMMINHIDSTVNVMINQMRDTLGNYYAGAYFDKVYTLSVDGVFEAKDYYAKMSDRVKNSSFGVDLKKAIDSMDNVSVGGTAPDFTLKTPDGKDVSLSDFKGHYLILDFWASWCSPCMREMPNVKAIYAKHHSDGLEIFGVSLDEDGAKWKNAITKNDLVWNHGSSLKGFDCPIAKTFGVSAIPRMYIIDPQGKIIAQDLRGQELADRIDQIYQKH